MMETFRSLAEPNRFQIVELLLDGPRPVGDLVDRLGLRQPQVSKHLRVLSDAGLVDVRVDAQRRIYALRPAPFQELEVWLERYRSEERRVGKSGKPGGWRTIKKENSIQNTGTSRASASSGKRKRSDASSAYA